MVRVLLIGNSGIKNHDFGGQTTKVRLYLKKLNDENVSHIFVDLENFNKHPFKILIQIRKSFHLCEKIVLITAKRGAKYLIPFINYLNRKARKDFVLPLIGTSILHYSIDKLSQDLQNDFIKNKNYSLVKPSKKIINQLKNITYILPETDLLTTIFTEYFKLNNVFTLTNFRDCKSTNNFKQSISKPIKLIFLSRIMEMKGIFDIIDICIKLNKKELKFSLDIYGKLDFTENQNKYFSKIVEKYDYFKFCGPIDNYSVINVIKEYDLFVFPTRCVYEGTPGVLAESLIAGTPILSSNFPQINVLLTPGYDSFVYEMFNKEDLEEKLNFIYNNSEILIYMSKNASESGQKYSYEVNRHIFLKYMS